MHGRASELKRAHSSSRAAALLASCALAMLLGCRAAAADKVTLTLGDTALTFPAADPDLVPQIGALENPLSVYVELKTTGATLSQLTVLAAGDLAAGPDQIPIERITWTAQGNGFVSGRLSKDEPQLVGQWQGRITEQGALLFWLENSWSYPTGDYSQTVVYTLVAY